MSLPHPYSEFSPNNLSLNGHTRFGMGLQNNRYEEMKPYRGFSQQNNHMAFKSTGTESSDKVDVLFMPKSCDLRAHGLEMCIYVLDVKSAHWSDGKSRFYQKKNKKKGKM